MPLEFFREEMYAFKQILASILNFFAMNSSYSFLCSSGVADLVATISQNMGATKESSIDLSVGVVLKKKVGEYVKAGESLAQIHAADDKSAAKAAEALLDCFKFSKEPVLRPRFIKDIVM